MKKPKKRSYVQPICGPCTFGVACNNIDQCLKQINLDSKKKKQLKFKAIKEALQRLGERFSEYSYPVRFSSEIYEAINGIMGIKDPYKEIKRISNEICLNLEEYFWNEIKKGKDFKEQLYIAILCSITGNLIDFGTGGYKFDLQSENIRDKYKQITNEGLAINELDKLIAKLDGHKSCLYLLDNAGEIVFDKLLIRLLKENGVYIVAMVKGGPIMNDATLDDAEMVGLNEYVDEMLTTGSNTYGIDPILANPDILIKFRSAPLIISKGQANYEAIKSFFDKNELNDVFFLLRVKCDVCAQLIGNVQKGNSVLMHFN